MSADDVILSKDPPGHPIYTQGPSHDSFNHAEKVLNADLDQDAIQVLPRPSKPPTRQDWEAYRSVFTQLYRTENRSLNEVISILADQYSFEAS